MLHNNSQLLVNQLQATTLLGERYSHIQLMNMPGGVKVGYFSLVFKAFDQVEQREVALKFFDLDPARRTPYRLLSFDREHVILQSLTRVGRCLQLASPMMTYQLTDPTNPHGITIDAKYFATEWCERDIEDYFLAHQTVDPAQSLRVFNDVVLAVEALHAKDVSHRDLKSDNFRGRGPGVPDDIVAIDLGTAAQLGAPAILADYSDPVGMLDYAPPEAFCSFAGDRELGRTADVFALGAMLFELFSSDDFPTAFRQLNPDFDLRLSAIESRIPVGVEFERRRAAWDSEAPKLFRGLTALDFRVPGCHVPLSVCDLLGQLVARMTQPNFRLRLISLPEVRCRLWSAIRCLENQKLADLRAARMQAMRSARNAKALVRAARVQSPSRVTHGRA